MPPARALRARAPAMDDNPTLRQTCSWENPRAPFAFKDSMIHWILQFTLLIAAGCVLHRCVSQEIHRQKLSLAFFFRPREAGASAHSDVKIRTVLKEKHGRGRPSGRQARPGVRWPFNGPGRPLNMVGYGSQSRQRSCRLDVAIGNDPSAGSPTETLLRLLLPLNDQVWPTFRHPALCCQSIGASQKASLNHSIGSSDGRCVQRAGT